MKKNIFALCALLAFTGGAFAAAMTSGAMDSASINPAALPLAGSVPGAFTSAAPTTPAPGAGVSGTTGTTPVCTSTTTPSVCTYHAVISSCLVGGSHYGGVSCAGVPGAPYITCTAPVTTTSCT